MLLYLVLGALTLFIIWLISVYNFFVSAKARIKAAVQEIGNQLKRQADLIPNLQSSVKGYLKHEKGIFRDLTSARKAIASAVKSGNAQKMANAGSKLAAILPDLKVLVEDNPQLKADNVVSRLMEELRDTADKVMYSRRLVIDLTADYNVRRVRFPTNILAQAFGFAELSGIITPEAGEHVQVKEKELKTPKVKL